MELKKISSPKATYKHLITNLRAALDGKAIEPLWWEVYHWYRTSDAWRGRLMQMVEGLYYDNSLFNIAGDQARALFEYPLRTNVSQIEKFANCPFAHLMRYGLKPERRKTFEIELPDIGTLFHDAVESFANSLGETAWQDVEPEKIQMIMEQIIDEMATANENKVLMSSSRNQYLVNKIKRIGNRAILTLTEHLKNGEFTPFQFEYGFQVNPSQGAVEPVIIDLDDQDRMIIEGRIDRVDSFEKDGELYIKVIDYKSGNKKFNLSEMYHGLQLQLAVYMKAVLNASGDKSYKPAGMFYFRIDDPLIETDTRDESMIHDEIFKSLKLDGIALEDMEVLKAMDDKIESGYKSDIIPVELKKSGEVSSRSSTADEPHMMMLLDYVEKKMKEIGGAIGDGVVRIEPCKSQGMTACDYCDYGSVCQFDTVFTGNRYKNIPKLTKEEAIEKMMRAGETNDNMD